MSDTNHIQRVDWNTYFMRIANEVATRSTCKRRQVGAVAVKNKRILATGYNGALARASHCISEDVGCLRDFLNVPSGERHELCRAVHAEQNLLIQAATYGFSLTGSTIYCTHQPCFICAKLLAACRIKAIYFQNEYPDALTVQMLNEIGIPIRKL